MLLIFGTVREVKRVEFCTANAQLNRNWTSYFFYQRSLRKMYKVLCRKEDFKGHQLDEEYVIYMYLMYCFLWVCKCSGSIKSAYDMKNIFCLSERPFKIQKNGVFLFEISFLFQRYWRFSILQIRPVMTSYCLQLKMVKYWINDITGKIEALLLKLSTIILHHKRSTMTPLMPLPWQQFGHWCCLNKD